jgi:hypothetical protein
MSAEPTPLPRPPRPSLVSLATAALLDVAARAGISGSEIEAVAARQPESSSDWWRRIDGPAPAPKDDAPILALAGLLDLGAVELLAVALLLAIEEDPLLARLVTRLQAPAGGSRPMVGLLSSAFEAAAAAPEEAYTELVDGPASAASVIVVRGDDQPLAERRLALSPPPSAHVFSAH